VKPQYRDDNDRSLRAKMARPKDLLAWFLAGFREEMPDDIHSREVWRDYVPDQHLSSGGGSLLGTPRYSDDFRRFLEDSPFATEASEYEGHKSLGNHYRTPMRAALARLAGRGPATQPYPFMAIVLYRTALRDGDWDGACASLGIIEPVRRPYIEAALHRLYDRFREEPPVYTVREDAA
jgi:hypothetical protein